MFIQDNERILIMDFGGSIGWGAPSSLLTVSELKDLKSIGIQTIFWQGALNWDELQLRDGAPPDLGKVGMYMERIQLAGLKALVPFLARVPSWKPEDWYLRRDYDGIPNYESEKALADYETMATALVDAFHGPDFQLVYMMPHGGEFPVHFHAYSSRLVLPGKNYEIPTEALVNWLIQLNRILEPQHNEVWGAYHHYTRPRWFPTVYDALRNEFPQSRFYSFQYTYFNPIKHRARIITDMQKARDVWKMDYFVGSEYVDGLRQNTPILKEHGIRGFITCPLHYEQPRRRLDAWCLSELEWALKELDK